MRFVTKTRVITAVIVGGLTSIASAKAAVTLSFDGAVMYDGHQYQGDPVLTLSGSFSLPNQYSTNSQWIWGLESIDLFVKEGNQTVFIFDDPSNILYNVSIGPGDDIINVGADINRPTNNFVGFTIVNGLLESADVTIPEYQWGYSFEGSGIGIGPSPYQFVTTTDIPVTITGVDEPPSLTVVGSILFLGLIFCSGARRGARHKGA
jgi:hypothetical protein